MTNLNTEDLIKCRDHLNEIIENYMVKRRNIFPGSITRDQFLLFGSKIRILIGISDEMTLMIVEGLLVSANENQQRIDDAVLVINNRIERLNQINQAIEDFANVINLFSGILGGIVSGSIPDLQKLLEPFFDG
ncbi:hypothetical protein [Acaryochloris marina]|uniref:Uncharacterized protein n=1 Tax=Acaryochloris marina (strain MBIC 11017) TaxID=329726 RepID=A8ZP54_ACAM1|nr:hypothetical protein [Acaryochloris marina]ABW32790.1 hypothetical protein AM1_E0020 [Acaryochloris marina MBIC11017]